MMHPWRITTFFLSLAFVLAACGTGGTPDASPTPAAGTPDPATSPDPGDNGTAADCGVDAFGGTAIPVNLQLQWVPQSQFAGYFAAKDLGMYDAVGLDVTILDGGPDIVPQQVVASPTGPEFGLAWVPKVLVSNEEGADLVNIAQIFQRSGTLSVAWADSGITEPADFEGRRIGVWDFGNEYEVVAAARAEGLEPDRDYDKVIQPFDMALLLNNEIDVAEAMIYNEYAQVLETVNPETGELYQPEDLNVIDYNEVGTAMLQDHVFARQSWLAQETNGIANEQVAVCFLRASFEGWMHCRDNLEECVDITLDQGTVLGEGHMRWMMNEINALIWPSPDGIGMMDEEQWAQTIEISLDYDILQQEPPSSAYRTDLTERALEGLDGDTTGDGFQKAEVEVTPGGE
jgi:NitT/TauT family transport system substrate-binding protein